MSSTVEPCAELGECIQTMRDVLAAHIRIIDLVICGLIKEESPARTGRQEIDPTVASVTAPLLQAAGSSSNTLVALSGRAGLHTRDCYSIARSIIETLVNACYVLSEGSSAAEKAIRHARQKAFRDLERESTIGESSIRLEYSGRPQAVELEGLDQDLAEFSSKAGREKGWIDLSIDDRLRSIGGGSSKLAMSRLHWARFMMYRHSSEILHGTLFGALYFFGRTSPTGRPRSVSELSESIGQQHMEILLAVIMAISGLTICASDTLGMTDPAQTSRSLFKKLYEIPYLDLGREGGADVES